MKTLLLLLFTSLLVGLSAQTTRVVYAIKMVPVEKPKLDTAAVKEMDQILGENFFGKMLEQANRRTFQLEFCAERSHEFIESPLTDADDLSDGIADILVGTSREYFYDLSTNRRVEQRMEQNGASCLGVVLSPDSMQWQIRNDTTTTILGRPCFLATTTYYRTVRGEPRAGIIRAWFTMTLPVPFGPRRYGGLPGLILQVSVKNITYTAVSIEPATERSCADLSVPDRRCTELTEAENRERQQAMRHRRRRN